MKVTFSILLTSISLAFVQSPVRADEVPTFDMRKNCKVDVEAYQGGGNPQGCLADEQGAKETLASQWTQFPADTRARCLRMVNSVVGAQSYVELLTCLQIAKDVKDLPKQ